MDSKTLLYKTISILDDKKAKDISTINISEISTLADYFLICSGTSITHIKALSDELEKKMKEDNVSYFHKEGYDSARWVLIDMGVVVVHIFHEEERSFYNLERIWSDGVINHIN